MSKKSKWFLWAASAAIIVAFARHLPAFPVSEGVADFSGGFGTAMLFGVLATWNDRRVQ